MVDIELRGDRLHLEVLGWDKLWCLKSSLDVPLSAIRDARIASSLPERFPVRWPGTSIPGVIRAGSYTKWNFKRWAFIDVRWGGKNAIFIDTTGWSYEYLFIDVADPPSAVARIRAACGLTAGNGKD
jgi:hypothetical protein